MRLALILRQAPHLVRALETAREVDAPEWLICAGAIRDAVWDALHERPPTVPHDIDLGFFDPAALTSARDMAVEEQLRARAPGLPWQARNQAAVHLWYPQHFGAEVAPFRSCAEAIRTFPEIASCVGVKLLADDDMLIVAPYGLDDLLSCVCRHNATRVSEDFYRRRVEERDWRSRWPRLVIAG